MKQVLAAIAVLLINCDGLFAETVSTRPNILIITADNLGYGDLQSYNPHSKIKTPRLDRLATEGARLTDFYTASSTCTVSRACLLTGRLNHREILIPQILKTAPVPYATGCFGKWNIGFAEGSRPTERGFDEFIGHASGNMDYYNHNYRTRHDLYEGTRELHREGEYATDIFADAAIDFIQRKSKTGDPWFCYLPFNAPHFPSAGNKKPGQPNIWQAPDWAFEAYGWSPDEQDYEKRYAAVVTALDRGIGQVLDALEASGQADNTFVFFFSDNGGFRLGREGIDIGINDPLRSGGVTCWEGGIRVVAMARWPGHIKAGSVIDEVSWSPDLMPACAELAGAKLPGGTIFDGKNPLPIFTDGARSPHKSLFFVYQNHAALREGDWKIVRENPADPWQLFNLRKDLSEADNLADKFPDRVARLEAVFNQWQKTF
jgi:arylsulfatase A